MKVSAVKEKAMARKPPIVIIGMGQLGGIFSTGFLRLGHPVFPMLRGDQPFKLADEIQPHMVVAAVGETDLDDLLNAVPEGWKDRILLLGNEILPANWLANNIQNPTVISVQFEVKPGQPVVVDRPSPVYGPQADLIIAALKRLSIPAIKINDLEAMTHHLVLKNLYILTLNLGGLATDATAGELLDQHQELTERVWTDLFELQQAMTEIRLDQTALMKQTMDYLALAPNRRAGRSAGARLARALDRAQALRIDVSTLTKIKQEATK